MKVPYDLAFETPRALWPEIHCHVIELTLDAPLTGGAREVISVTARGGKAGVTQIGELAKALADATHSEVLVTGDSTQQTSPPHEALSPCPRGSRRW